MKDEDEIVKRLKMVADDLSKLKRDSVAAGIIAMDVLGIANTVTRLEYLVGRLTSPPKSSLKAEVNADKYRRS